MSKQVKESWKLAAVTTVVMLLTLVHVAKAEDFDPASESYDPSRTTTGAPQDPYQVSNQAPEAVAGVEQTSDTETVETQVTNINGRNEVSAMYFTQVGSPTLGTHPWYDTHGNTVGVSFSQNGNYIFTFDKVKMDFRCSFTAAQVKDWKDRAYQAYLQNTNSSWALANYTQADSILQAMQQVAYAKDQHEPTQRY